MDIIRYKVALLKVTKAFLKGKPFGFQVCSANSGAERRAPHIAACSQAKIRYLGFINNPTYLLIYTYLQ